MQEAHGSVCADLSEDQVDELIRAMPYSWDMLSMSNARQWDEFRRQAGCRDYYITREGALQGDIKCRRLMMTFALICLKNRLTR